VHLKKYYNQYIKICLYFSIIAMVGSILYFSISALYDSLKEKPHFYYGTIDNSSGLLDKYKYFFVAKDEETAKKIRIYILDNLNTLNFELSNIRTVAVGETAKIFESPHQDSTILFIETNTKTLYDGTELTKGYIAKEFIIENK
jgi:hypothetical protein